MAITNDKDYTTDIAGSTSNTLVGKSDFYNGMLNSKSGSIADPLISGYAYAIWLKVPGWIDDEQGEQFKSFFYRNFKSLEGISDISLEVAGIASGFANNELQHATTINKGNTEFTVNHQEFTGSPTRKFYERWIYGIRDPRTGIATYPVKYPDYHYSAENHTGELLFCNTRPDATNTSGDNIEFACLWTLVMPKNIVLGHFNFTEGTHDFAQYSQAFSGDFHYGPEIYELAAEVLPAHIEELNIESMLTFSNKESAQ